MAHFIVTFRIAEDETYQERYIALVEAVAAIAGGKVWDETTSFFAFEGARQSAMRMAEILFSRANLNSKTDLLLVINLNHREKVVLGQLKDQQLLEVCLGFPSQMPDLL